MINPKLASIRIVLLQTFHPGNIGAVARAMKTMGLSDLVLVEPNEFPSEEATSRAAGAIDLLENATVVGSLQEAIKDCTQVFATTARQNRKFSRPQKSCEQAVSWIFEHPHEKSAIVFGRERMGMTNEDIHLCQQILYIEGNPEYDVLNMASAAQIVCYELFRQFNASYPNEKNLAPNNKSNEIDSSVLALQSDLHYFYQHLQELLEKSHYLNPSQQSDTMPRLKEFFNRASPTQSDIRMLRGLLKSLDQFNE